MLRPITLAALLLAVCPTLSSAQTVRFLTSVGDFFLELNPTDNADLEGHVDNLLAYVGAGRYHGVVVNRASEGFVLQLGGFTGEGVSLDTLPPDGLAAIDKFDQVIVDNNGDGQVDFDTTGLTNTPGTVSLALAAGNPNSGNSSFFVNISSNTFLDSQGFVPFANVDDMTTINRIMNQPQVDLTTQLNRPGDLTYSDVPLTDDGEFVILESVMVMDPSFSFEGPLRRVLNLSVDGTIISGTSAASASSALAATSDGGSTSLSSFSSSAAPEPGTVVLLAIGVGAGLCRRQRG